MKAQPSALRTYFALTRRDVGVLAALGVLAFLLRYWLFTLDPIVHSDGIDYVGAGISIVSGTPAFIDENWYVFDRDKPIYPLLIGLAHLVVRDYTVVAASVSMVMGSLALVPLFLFARNLYGPTAGYLGAFIMTWYPYLANNAATDYISATWVFFLLTAAYIGWVAHRVNVLRWYVAAGVAAGLAYLTRFEVIGYVALYVVVLAVGPRTRSLRNIGAAIVAFLFIVSPFHLYNVAQTGSPRLLAKLESGLKSHMPDRGFVRGDPAYDFFFRDALGYVRFYLWGVGTMYSKHLPGVFPPLLIAIGTVGVVERWRRGALGFGDAYLLSLITLPLAYIPLLRPSARNLIDYLPFAIVLLAAGIAALPGAVGRPVSAGWGVRGERLVVVAATGLVFVSTFPYTLRPLVRGPDPATPLELMEIGQWMRRNLPPQRLIMTTGPHRRHTLLILDLLQAM